MGKKSKKSSSPKPRNRSRSKSPPAKKQRAGREVPWLIQLLSYFNIFTPANTEAEKTKADLYLEVEDSGATTGRFRWVISGKNHITACFRATDILTKHLRENYEFTYVVKPADIKLSMNMTSTSWMDLADLVAKGHISVSLHGEDASHSFLGEHTQSKFKRKINSSV
jgi:hypothetical protein